MYASVIGKKLVGLCNKIENKKRTIRGFWNDVYVPLFFNQPKYMISAGNTPLENPKIPWDKQKYPSAKERSDRIQKIVYNIENNSPDTTNSIVSGSSDHTSTTSGQLTSLIVPFSAEDIYASWFGVGLGIRVEGGLILLIDNEEIIKTLYEGWYKYRELLNETPNVKGNQVEAWNAHWLTFSYSNENYREKNIILPFEKDRSLNKIDTLSWIKVLFALAKRFPKQKLTAYVYSLGQTNTTIGFIQINLPEIKREIEMYNFLFGSFDVNLKKAIEDVYTTQFSSKSVCQNGAIGLKEIEPKDLREYLPNKKKVSKEIKFKNDEKSLINYNIYLSWVIAMLNDKTTIQKAEDTANALISYEGTSTRGKKIESNQVKLLLDSISRKAFIENLIPLLTNDVTNNDFLNELVEEIDKMQADKFPYFLTLLKFKYAFLSNKNSKGEKK